jgi:hypothetical protein
LITVAVMFIIPATAYFAFRSASVQTWIAGKITAYLSKELNATVKVGGVNISALLNIVLEEVEVYDQKHNPLVTTHRIVLDIKSLKFSRRILHVRKILLDEATVNLIRPLDEDINFQFLVDYFGNFNRDTLSMEPWDVTVESFEFRNSGISMVDHNAPKIEYGFDINHFSFTELNIEVKDILLEKDTLQAAIERFSVKESGGFYIDNLTAGLFFSPGKSFIHNVRFVSQQSDITMDIDLTHNGYEAFKNIIDDVSMVVDLKPSAISLNEVGYYFHGAYGIDGLINVSGLFTGKVSNLRGKDITLKYGILTQLKGNFNLVGLPEIGETFMNLSVERLVTNKHEIESFRLPDSSPQPYITLPDEVRKLGIISFSGNFTGFLYDFVAFGKFQTSIGSISTDIAIISNDDYKDVRFIGNVATRGFNMGILVNDRENFGKISLSTHVEGKGTNLNNFDARITGQIQSFTFRQYDYKQLMIAGDLSNRKFNGSFKVEDPNLFLDFGGVINFENQTPLMNFTARIENANLSKLNIYQRDSAYHSIFSTLIKVNGKGNSLATMEGEIHAYSTEYREKAVNENDSTENFVIRTDLIALENYIISGKHKELKLFSDFVDARITGELNYDKIGSSINSFLYHFAPSRFSENPNPEKNGNGNSYQNAEFQIHIKNTQQLTQHFIPSVSVAPYSFFNGNFSTARNELVLHGRSDYAGFGNLLLKNVNINVASNYQNLEITTTGSKLYLTDTLKLENFFTSGVISNDTLSFYAQWENEGLKRNHGIIKSRGIIKSPQRTEFHVLPSYAFVNDSLWNISQDNKIIIDSTSVSIQNFHLSKQHEYLLVNGTLSENQEDVLAIRLNNFNLESFAFLLSDRQVDFGGMASGELQISDIKNAPNIHTNLFIRNFSFNKDHLGDLSLKSQWDPREKAFRVNTEIIYRGNIGTNKPVVATGYFYPNRKDDNFDLNIIVENLKMSVFGRYLEDFASNFRGLASGKFKLKGPLAAPHLSGKARLVRTGFRVDYLNTSYSFAHEIEVEKNHFKFDNLIINDTLGNSARASGIIRHRNFHGFNIDITVNPERMIVLNTQPHHNELFYGKAFATGHAHIHGPVNDIRIDVTATSNRGTQIFLPLDYYGELTESNFISFVSKDNKENGSSLFQMPADMGISLNFDLSLTPDAEVQIIFDSKIGDIMRGRGFGDLKLEMDKQGFFYMYGDYTIQEGDYLFTLQNLINKRFRMEQGGTIRWTGDPYDADINLRALYRLRTSLYDLAANQTDTSDVYRRRIPVETVLHLRDKLFNPSVNFEIQLPGTDESTREMIQRLITTEQEMNRQVFSLLILNRFVAPEDGFNSAIGYGMGTTSSELLSNQLSNWLSQISSDFDIGINYRPGDEISSQEIELALSTQIFNDRVVIDGNFGVAGHNPAQTQRTSNIIGDVNVEVKITPEGKFRVKAFNRSNTFDIMNTNAPYTQGVGVFYRREFDSFGDLFRRKRTVVQEVPEIQDVENTFNDGIEIISQPF